MEFELPNLCTKVQMLISVQYEMASYIHTDAFSHPDNCLSRMLTVQSRRFLNISPMCSRLVLVFLSTQDWNGQTCCPGLGHINSLYLVRLSYSIHILLIVTSNLQQILQGWFLLQTTYPPTAADGLEN